MKQKNVLTLSQRKFMDKFPTNKLQQISMTREKNNQLSTVYLADLSVS